MRIQPFMSFLQSSLQLDLNKTTYFLTDVDFVGGWEVWLQCNIGFAGRNAVGRARMTREACYPSQFGGQYLSYNILTQAVAVTPNANAAARCDFLLENTVGLADSTYVELKCATSSESSVNTWQRFANDLSKIQALTGANPNINAAALLAIHATLDPQQIAAISNNLPRNTSFVLDYSPGPGQQPLMTTIPNVASGGAPRMLLFGVSPH